MGYHGPTMDVAATGCPARDQGSPCTGQREDVVRVCVTSRGTVPGLGPGRRGPGTGRVSHRGHRRARRRNHRPGHASEQREKRFLGHAELVALEEADKQQLFEGYVARHEPGPMRNWAETLTRSLKMNAPLYVECFVCRKHRGEISVPGGVIYEDDLIYISHAQLWGDEKEHYLGHLIVEPKRHAPELADLTREEAQAIGLYTSRLARALMHTERVEHVYSFVIGDGVPHVHVHVIGRYPGAPREYWGPKVDEWPEAPRGGEREIEQVAARVRAFLREHYT